MVAGYHSFLLFPIGRRDQDLLSLKSFSDRSERRSVSGHSEDALHDFGGLRIDQKRFVFGHLVAVGDRSAASDSMLHSITEDGFDLLAGIPGIPLVHDIQERSELVLGRTVAVHIVIDGDKPHAFFRKEDLGVETDLKIIPADS